MEYIMWKKSMRNFYKLNVIFGKQRSFFEKLKKQKKTEKHTKNRVKPHTHVDLQKEMSETSEIKITKVKNVTADEMLTLDEPIYKTLVIFMIF